MPRTLRPGQRSELYVVDVATNTHRLVFSSDEVLFEAPNWLPDGTLVVNGNGLLFRVTDALEEIELGGVPAINNDHVVSPDGRTVYVSANDGHIYAAPIEGGPGRRVTNDRGPGFHHYLHGVSPDGTTLAYIGLEWVGDRRITNVWTIPAAGGADVPVTDDMFADDGSEFSPDGRWIYFNSERDGHAQLFRVLVEGSAIEKLTFDERVNWFPHPAPDWSAVAYVSFPPGTEGHPADIDDVRLRLLTNDGEIRELTSLFGGQGTMNVPSWSPDSASFAYVTYPL
ncbi:WD40 repeat protein [Kribbella pratensis]|uniref:WD40 repeat protein n=1 Tax=Kribbella pratensis TaxID=2512112 RepID=A0ABY2FN03_9ACTN|nr:PD40 domain-containing protein [Kribbella pratensis]TDW94521.1 WD40 repeat protein [Kribbella pratensis]